MYVIRLGENKIIPSTIRIHLNLFTLEHPYFCKSNQTLLCKHISNTFQKYFQQDSM